jgi:hypothetical protein
MSESIEARAVLNSESNQRKFEELKEYLKNDIEDSVSEKTGTSAVTRLAIRLGHERMEELKEEKQMSMKEFQRVERKMRKLAEDI